MDCNKKVSVSVPFELGDSTNIADAQELKKIITSIQPTDSSELLPKAQELSIPIIDKNTPEKNQVLKQGLFICSRIEKWYKKSLNLGEIELKKTRLRWRQFKAILYPDRLELYHFTNLIIQTTKLAYTIYLNKEYPYRPVKLSLISPQDFVWSLQYLHYKRKSCISFHFVFSKISEAQEWYMLIYQQLPNIVHYKKLIPSHVDIRLMDYNKSPPVVIRLPLQLLQYSQVDIPIEKLKSVLIQLLNRELSIPMEQLGNMKLCWQPETMHIPQLTIPWMNALNQLVIPSLIEQTHQLELYLQEPPTKRIKNYDGLLVQKIWNEKRQKFVRDRPFYGLLFGHHLFLFDGPFYSKYKKELQKQIQEEKKGRYHWLQVTTGLLFQQRKIVISKNSNNKTIFKSAPLFHPKSPTVSLPETLKLFNSHYMIDLQHQVIRAQLSTHHTSRGRVLEIELKEGGILYYEAPNTQIMLQWITMINNSIPLDHFLLFDTIAYKKQTILLSGELYMKENYRGTFKRYHCVLSKDKESEGMMLYKKNDKLQLYEKHQCIALGQQYIYSGDECILEEPQQVTAANYYYYYADDQLVTRQGKTSDCLFVIWQMKSRHFIPKIREYLSLFKFGHRLGNRGHYWIFKARNKQERDEWIWALHFQIEK